MLALPPVWLQDTGLRTHEFASLVTSAQTRWPNARDFMIIVILHILFIIASSYAHTHANGDEEGEKASLTEQCQLQPQSSSHNSHAIC
jgi:hypothetical protein